MHVCLRVSTCVYVCQCVCMCVRACMCVCACACMRLNTYVRARIRRVCVCVCGAHVYVRRMRVRVWSACVRAIKNMAFAHTKPPLPFNLHTPRWSGSCSTPPWGPPATGTRCTPTRMRHGCIRRRRWVSQVEVLEVCVRHAKVGAGMAGSVCCEAAGTCRNGCQLQRTASHCIALHRTASHCTTLQRIATHCNTLPEFGYRLDKLPHSL